MKITNEMLLEELVKSLGMKEILLEGVNEVEKLLENTTKEEITLKNQMIAKGCAVQLLELLENLKNYCSNEEIENLDDRFQNIWEKFYNKSQEFVGKEFIK